MFFRQRCVFCVANRFAQCITTCYTKRHSKLPQQKVSLFLEEIERFFWLIIKFNQFIPCWLCLHRFHSTFTRGRERKDALIFSAVLTTIFLKTVVAIFYILQKKVDRALMYVWRSFWLSATWSWLIGKIVFEFLWSDGRGAKVWFVQCFMLKI